MKSLLAEKKGVSPLIATILLIGIAIVMFVIIFMWLRGMVTEQYEKFGQPLETVCQKVTFTATKDANNIYINNQGSVPIIGILPKVEVNKRITAERLVVRPLDSVIEIAEIDPVPIENMRRVKSIINTSGAKITVTPVIQAKSKKTGRPSNQACRDKALEISR